PELDLPKLQSLPADQQQLFLLTSVAALTKHVLALSNDDCTAQQFYLKKEVFQIINLTTPQPTRVVRNNLGKCLAHIFGHGDRKLLFETINDLVSITQGGKGKAESSQRAKHAAVVCLEGLDVQGVIVEIARALCVSHPSARKKNAADDGNLSDDIEQLFELTRIIVLVLSGLLPNLTGENQPI
ncbi:hypothetical protein BN1723_018656, partial [Verticillium longisporum]